MLDLVIGSACLFLPPNIQAGIVGGTFLFGAIRKHQRRRRLESSEKSVGRESGVTLSWSEVTCRLALKEGAERVLLDRLQGEAKPGRILAIFGPSGSGACWYGCDCGVLFCMYDMMGVYTCAGKTTLLNTLAGQLPFSKSLHLEGYVTANGNQMPSPHVKTGFVAQEDLFFSQLTVRETLSMAAELRTRSGTTNEEREALVESVIRRLGLLKCADTVIGDAKTRGLSGGEKKRLSIACEMIAKPQLIMADEPTSGLDAFAAQQVVGALKDLASEGNTIVMSIHQPRSSIFEMLDDLCLLSEGKLIYFGSAKDVLSYFESQGYPCPEHYNPAEFLADLVAIDHSSPETEEESLNRVNALASAWKASQGEAGSPAIQTPEQDPELVVRNPGCSLPRQIALLLNRSWKQISRDKATLISRASSQMSSAIVFSAIYWKLGLKQSDIQSRLGLIQVSCIGTAMTSLIKTLNVFPRERTIVQRERGRSAYPVISYFASKLAAELPIGSIFPMLFGAVVYPCTGLAPNPIKFANFLGILVAESFAAQALGLAVGAAAPSTSAALAIGPAVILVSIVFGGLFVNAEGVPKPLKWIPKTSLIKHAFEGATINEFTGLEFECPPGRPGAPKTKAGEDVLSELGAANDTIRETFVNQGRVILMYWWIAFRILKKKKPRYMTLHHPRGLGKPQ